MGNTEQVTTVNEQPAIDPSQQEVAVEQEQQEQAKPTSEEVRLEQSMDPKNKTSVAKKSPQAVQRKAINDSEEKIEDVEATKEIEEDDKTDSKGNSKYSFAEAMMSGVDAKTIAENSSGEEFFLPEDDDIDKLLTEKGVEEEQLPLMKEEIKVQYNNLKNGVYDNNPNDGTKTTLVDKLYGNSYTRQKEDDYYQAHALGTGAASQYSNVFSNLDTEKIQYFDEGTGKMEERNLGLQDMYFNPNLIVDFEKDANGHRIGKGFVRELSKGESRIGKTVLPVWGNPEVYDLNWYDFPAGFVSGLVPSFVESVLSVVEMAYHLPGNVFGYGDESENLNWFESALDSSILATQRYQYKASDKIAEGGFLGGSPASFMYAMSEGLGELTSQIAAGALTGGASIGASVLAAGGKSMAKQLVRSTAISVAEKKIVSSALKAAAKKGSGKAITTAEKKFIKDADKIIAKAAGSKLDDVAALEIMQIATKTGFKRYANKYSAVGTMQAMTGTYNEMLANGISQTTASGMAIAMAPFVYASERLIGSHWLKGKLGVAQLERGAARYVSETVGEVAEASTKAVGKTVGKLSKNAPSKLSTKKGLDETVTAYSKRMAKAAAKATGDTVGGVLKKMTPKSIGKGIKSSALATKGLGKSANSALDAMEEMYDKIKFSKGYFNPASMVKAALSEGVQEATEQSMYIASYFLHDNFIANKDAVKGGGAMGYFSLKDDVFSRKTWHELKENFVGGFAIGGFAAGAMRQRDNSYANGDFAAVAASKGETREAMQEMFSIYNADANQFGSTEHSPDLKVLKKNGKDSDWVEVQEDFSEFGLKKGQKLKSEAEVNFYNMLTHFDATDKMYKETGLEENVLSRFANDTSVFMQGIAAFKVKKNGEERLSKINEELEAKDISPEAKKKLEEEKVSTEKGIQKAKNTYTYLMQDEVGTINSQLETINKDIEVKSAVEEDSPTFVQAKKDLEELGRTKTKLEEHLTGIENSGSKGYSRGFKDKIKNNMAVVMLANDHAMSVMRKDPAFNEKYGPDATEFAEEDVKKFISSRNDFMGKYGGDNFYKNNLDSYDYMRDEAIRIRKENEIIVKNAESSTESTQEEVDTLETGIASLEVEVNDIAKLTEGGITDVNELLAKRASVFQNAITLADNLVNNAKKSTASKEIMGVMGNMQKRISSVIGQVGAQPDEADFSTQNEAFFEKTIDDNKRSTYSKKTLKEGDDTSAFISNDALLTQMSETQKNVDPVLEQVIKQKREQYEQAKIMLENSNENAIDAAYYNGASTLLGELDRIDQEDSYDKEPLSQYLQSIKEWQRILDQLENSTKIRSYMISPLSGTEDGKFLDHMADVGMDTLKAKAVLENIAKQKAELKAYEEKISKKVGAKDSFFALERHGNLINNVHFLRGLLENAKVKEVVPPQMLEKINGLKLTDFDSSKTEYTDDELTNLDNAEREIFKLMDDMKQYKDVVITEEVITSIFDSLYYNENDTGMNYNYKNAYNAYGKIEYYNQFGSSIKEGYGEFVSNESLEGYQYFVNRLITTFSDLSTADLASARLTYYNDLDLDIASTTEQIIPENEMLAFFNGGDEILQLIKKIETKYHESKDVELEKYNPHTAFLAGNVQTGKSVQMVPQIILLQSKLGRTDNFVLIAHSKETLNNFNKISKNLIAMDPSLEGKIHIKYHTDFIDNGVDFDLKNSIIIADEGTILTNKKTDSIYSKYLENSSNNNKVMYVGDESQMTNFVGKEAQPRSHVDTLGFNNMPTSKKFASSNPMLINLMDIAIQNANTMNKDGYPPAYSENVNNVMRGVDYFGSQDDIAKAFLKRVADGINPDQISLVFLTEIHYNDFLANSTVSEDIKKLDKNFIKVLGNDESKNGHTFSSIQGDRKNEIYNMYDGSQESFYKYNDNDTLETYELKNGNATYTIFGRSKSYIATLGDPKNYADKKPVNFVADAEPLQDKEPILLYLTNVMGGVAGKGTETKAKATSIQQAPIQVDDSTKSKMTKEQIDTLTRLESFQKETTSVLTKDESKYIVTNSKGTRHLNRLTGGVFDSRLSVAQVLAQNAIKNGKVLPFNVQRASSIGTAVDKLFREIVGSNNEIFDDKGKPIYTTLWMNNRNEAITVTNQDGSKKVTKSTIWNSQEDFNSFVDLFVAFRVDLESQGLFLITDEIVFSNEYIDIATTPDLITINEQGVLGIIDLKTKHKGSASRLNDIVPYKDLRDPVTDEVYQSSPLDTHTHQINGIVEIIKPLNISSSPDIEMGLVTTVYDDVTKDVADSRAKKSMQFPIGLPYQEGVSVDNVKLEVLPIDHVVTNIAEEIEMKKSSNRSVPKYLANFFTTGNFNISVAEEYYEKNDLSSSIVVNDIVEKEGVVTIYGESNGQKLSFFPEEFYHNYTDIKPDISGSTINMKPIGVEGSHYNSAKKFLDSGGSVVYSTPENIAISTNQLRAIGITGKKNLQLVKNIKSKIASKANMKLVFKTSINTTSDNLDNVTYNNVLVGESTDDVISLINSIKPELNESETKLVDKVLNGLTAANKSDFEQLFGTVVAVSYAKIYDATAGGYITIDINHSTDINKVITDIRASSIPPVKGIDPKESQIRNEIVQNYNIGLAIMHYNGAMKAKDEGSSSVDLQDQLKYDSKQRDVVQMLAPKDTKLSTLVTESSVKGYVFNTTIDTNYEDGFGIRASYGPVFDPNSNYLIKVFSPKLSDKTKLKASYTSELKSNLKFYKTTRDLNQASKDWNHMSDFVMKLLNKNSKIVIKNLRKSKLKDGRKLSSILFVDTNGKLDVVKRDPNGKGYVQSFQEKAENLVAITEFLIDTIAKDGGKNFKDFRYSAIGGKIDLTQYTTPVQRLNRPSLSLSIAANVLSLTKKTTSKKRKTKIRKRTNTLSSNFDGSYTGEFVSRQKANNIISNILGDPYSNEWVGFQRNLTNDDIKVWGLMNRGQIKLSLDKKGRVNKSTIRHEIFHVVDEYYLSDDTQERIYGLVREAVPGMDKNSTDLEVKEWLADWYGEHGETYGIIDAELINEAYLSRYGLLLDGVTSRFIELQKELTGVLGDIEKGKYKNRVPLNSNIQNASLNTSVFMSKKNMLVSQSDKVKLMSVAKQFAENEDDKTQIKNSDMEKLSIKELERVFGDTDNIAESSEHLSYLIYELSEYSGGELSLEDSISEIGDHKIGAENHILAEDVENPDVVKNLTAESFKTMSFAERQDYITYHIANDWRVAKGLMKIVFPNYNMKRNTIGKVSKAAYGDTKIDPRLSVNDKIAWLNSTVVEVIPNEKGNNGEVMEGSFLNSNVVISIMEKASESIQKKINTGSIIRVEDYKKELQANLERMRTGNGSRRDIMAFSLLKKFFYGYDQGDVVKDGNIIESYYDLDAISQMAFNEDKSKYDPSNNGNETEVEDLLIAYLSNYRNIVTAGKVKTEFKDRSKMSIVNLSVNTLDEYKNLIKNNLDITLYAGTNLRSSFVKTYTVKNSDDKNYVRANSEGVFIGDNKILVSTERDGNLFYSFAPGMMTYTNFKNLSIKVGLGSLSENMFNDLKNSKKTFGEGKYADTGAIIGAKNLTPMELFSTIAGNYVELISNNINLEKAADSLRDDYVTNHGKKWAQKEEIYKEYEKELDELITAEFLPSKQLAQFKKNINYSVKNEDDIEANQDNTDNDDHELEYGSYIFPKPSGFYSYINVLAEFNYATKQNVGVSFNYLGGVRYNDLETGNAISTALSNNDQLNDRSQTNFIDDSVNLKLSDYVPEIVTIVTPKGSLAQSNSPFVSDKITINGRTTNVEGSVPEARIISTAANPVLESKYINTKNPSKGDTAKVFMGVFLDSINSNSRRVTLPLGYTSTQNYVQLEFSQNMGNFINATFNKDGSLATFNFDENALIPVFEKNFRHYNRLAEVSVNKWASVLESRKGIDILFSGNTKLLAALKSGSYNSKDSIWSEMKDDNGEFKKTEISLDIKDDIMNSILVANSDYVFSTEKTTDPNTKKTTTKNFIQLGNHTLFHIPGSSTYTLDKFNSLNKGKIYKKDLMNIVGEELSESNSYMSRLINEGVQPNNYGEFMGINKWFEGSIPTNYEMKSKLRAYNSKTKKSYYNPVYQAIGMLHMAMAPALTTEVAGTEGQYANLTDYFKRFSTNNTPINKIVPGVKGGLDLTSNMMIYDDLSESIQMRVPVRVIKDGKKTTEYVYRTESIRSNDGGGKGFVGFYLMLNKSFGGTNSKFSKDILKDLMVGADRITGSNIILKQALDFQSDSLINNNDDIKDEQLEMIDLWNQTINKIIEESGLEDTVQLDLVEQFFKYQDNNPSSFYDNTQKLIDDIFNLNSSLYDSIPLGIKDQIKDQIVNNVPMGYMPLSSIKSGAYNITSEIPGQADIENVSNVSVDLSKFGLINDFSSEINGESNVALMNQMLSHITDMNVNSEVEAALSQITKQGLEDLFTEIGLPIDVNNWNENSVDTFRSYLRSIGIEAASTNTGNNALLEVLKINGSIDTLQLTKTLEAQFGSRINNVIMPRLHGSRYIQSSGENISYYRNNKTGSIYNKSTLLKSYTEEEIDNQFTKSGLDYMHVDENGVHHDGEVAAKFMYSTEFGISEDLQEQPEDAYSLFVNESLNLDTQHIFEANRNKSKAELQKALKEYLDQYKGVKVTFANSPFTRVARQFKDKRNSSSSTDVEIDAKLIDSFMSYLMNFDESLEVMSARIPFDSLSLGFKGRIRQFVWGNGSAIYINPLENIRSGGDYDIDQLSVYYRGYKSAFEKSSGDNLEGNKNKLIDSIMGFYSNPKYRDDIYGTTGTEEIEQAISDYKKETSKQDSSASIDPDNKVYKNKRFHNMSGLIELDELASSGDEAIAILASSVSAYSYALQMQRSNTGNKFKQTREDASYNKSNLSGLLQGALDNLKKMIVGEFGTTALGINMLTGMAVQGLSYNEMLKLTHSKVGTYIFRELGKGQDIFESKKSIPILIEGSYIFIEESIIKAGEQIDDDFDFKNDADRKMYLQKVKELTSRTNKVADDAVEFFRLRYNALYTERKNVQTKLNNKSITETEKTKLKELKKDIQSKLELLYPLKTDSYRKSMKDLKVLKESYVLGESLRQFGQFVKLRNGIPSSNTDSVFLKRRLEATLGESLSSFLDPTTQTKTSKERLNYYLNNDNYFRSLNEEEQAIQKEYMDLVTNALSIPKMIENQSYFKGLLSNLNNHSAILNKTFFIYSSEFTSLEYSTMADQNKVGAQFPNELNVFPNIANDLLVELTLSELNEPFTLSIPLSMKAKDNTTKEYYNKYYPDSNFLSNVDVRTQKGKKDYVKHFPNMINELKLFLELKPMQSSIKTYFEAMGIPISDDESAYLINRNVLNHLMLRGNDGYEELGVDPSINSNDTAVRDVRNQIKLLPPKLQLMLEIYDQISSKGFYTKRGLTEILTKNLSTTLKTNLEHNKNTLLANVSSNMENLKNFAGLNKEIKSEYDKETQEENPKTFVMYKKDLGFEKKRRQSGIITGQKNASSEDIIIDHSPKYYKLPASINDDNTLVNIDSIKFKNENDYDLNELIAAEKANPGSSGSFRVVFQAPHSYLNGVHVTDTGILVDVRADGLFAIDISLTEDSLETILKRKETYQRTKNSYIPRSVAQINQMIDSDLNLSLITYKNMSYAKTATFSNLFPKRNNPVSATYKAGNNDVGKHYVEVIPQPVEFSATELKDELQRQGIKVRDMKTVLGVDYLNSIGQDKKATELSTWFDTKSTRKQDVKYFIFVTKGQSISNDNGLEFELSNNHNNSVKCKK